MAELTYLDQHILANDEDWQNRIQQASAATAFVLLDEDHAGQDFQEAKARQILAQEVIRSPERHTSRFAILLSTQVPDTLITTDGSTITENDVTDTQLGTFIEDNWSKLAGIGSDLPDMS